MDRNQKSSCNRQGKSGSLMGYSTDFIGELYFKEPLNIQQRKEVEKFCGEDLRNHPEWEPTNGMTWMDLEVNDDWTGLRWDGSEKTYDLCEKINLIVREMRKKWPEFGFKSGRIEAQGEAMEDKWYMVPKEDGFVESKSFPQLKEKVECPHCGESFSIDGT